MKTLYKRIVTLTASLIFLCSIAAYGQTPILQNNFANIEPAIQGPERRVVNEVMSCLQPEDRQNVMIINTNGTIYANKQWLKTAIVNAKKNALGLYVDQKGHSFPLPQLLPKPRLAPKALQIPERSAIGKYPTPLVWKPAPYPGSGPYRQIYSRVPSDNNTAGYSYEESQVFLPSSTSVPQQLNEHVGQHPPAGEAAGIVNDTVTIYMGGWSAGTVDTTGYATDVGFAHDNGTNVGATSGRTHDNWYMFVNTETLPQLTQPTEVAYAIRILPNQSPTFKFYVSYDDKPGSQTYQHHFLVLAVSNANAVKVGTDGPQIGSSWTITQDVSNLGAIPNNPFSISGAGMVLKRMTSIAQPNPQNQEHFHTCSFVKQVIWSNCKIGLTGQAPLAWGPDTQTNVSSYGGFFNYPPSTDPAPRNTIVTPPGAPADFSTETVSISIPR